MKKIIYAIIAGVVLMACGAGAMLLLEGEAAHILGAALFMMSVVPAMNAADDFETYEETHEYEEILNTKY